MPSTISFTRSQAEQAVAESRSYSEALRRLRLRAAGGNHRTLRKYVELWEIPTDHFDPNWALRRRNGDRRKGLDEILVRNSTYSRGHLKERLFDEGIKKRECELCGQEETWRGERMALILDHVNGVADDNRLENLRIACPNCAATFNTHCGRANKRPPVERSCARCGEHFRVRYASHRYCSQSCGTRASRPSRGIPQPGRRKVDRPSLEQLRTDLERMSVCAVGRKYGVSDNAVRKWLVWYERERQRSADCGSGSEEGSG